jgi:hypothetical protein
MMILMMKKMMIIICSEALQKIICHLVKEFPTFIEHSYSKQMDHSDLHG